MYIEYGCPSDNTKVQNYGEFHTGMDVNVSGIKKKKMTLRWVVNG